MRRNLLFNVFTIASLALLPSLTLSAQKAERGYWPHNKRELIWPKGKMPDRDTAQYAAMEYEYAAKGFRKEGHREPFLEWFDAPPKEKQVGTCAILLSGDGYNGLCRMSRIKKWCERLTQEGVQCVNLVYRVPRPEGHSFYQSAWEDAQRAVRIVRSEAARRGYSPDRIGVVGMSAGSHLGLLLASSATAKAYAPVDKLDSVPCNVNFAVLYATAHATTDGRGAAPSRDGYGTDVSLGKEFAFDSLTCPMVLVHGGKDTLASPNASTLVYRQLRRMKIPAEVHLYPDMDHNSNGYETERPIEFLRQTGYLGKLQPEVKIMDRMRGDSACVRYLKEDVWPQGKMPDRQSNQCEPYIEWHFPDTLRTRAIQIVYSGGGYYSNDTYGFGVAPQRIYLNRRGMTVVTMRYRAPRPAAESGLDKHTTAWQDLQRTIRLVRSEAPKYGLDPNRIGIMGNSAGGHLTILGVTSSMHETYLAIDSIDKQPCNVQWGVAFYPAYVLSDGVDGENKEGGNEDRDIINPEFSFDLNTSPMLFVHGDADGWAAMSSVKTWEKMRAIGVQSELHTLALRKHCFMEKASPGTGSYTYLDRIWEFLTRKGFNN